MLGKSVKFEKIHQTQLEWKKIQGKTRKFEKKEKNDKFEETGGKHC